MDAVFELREDALERVYDGTDQHSIPLENTFRAHN